MAGNSRGWDEAPAATVCFLHRGGRVLLQRRAAGRLWAGRLNGPGGKIDARETPEQAVAREVAEETGLRLISPMRHGALILRFGSSEGARLHVHVFTCEEFAGRARGGREGALRWYSEQRLPFDRLWPDMRYWLPAVLDGGSVAGHCLYDAAGERMIACNLGLRLPDETLLQKPTAGAIASLDDLRVGGGDCQPGPRDDAADW